MTTEHEPYDDEAQAESRAKATEQAVRIKALADDDFRWLMEDKRGRRIVWGMLTEAGVFRISYDGTALGTVFREGERNHGVRLISRIHELCPEKYTLMLKEAKHATGRISTTR